MAEVFTIAGSSPLGATPPGWALTPNGNMGAPVAGCPANMREGNACRSTQAVALQTALLSLGRTVGDPRLTGIKQDGFLGPETLFALNTAMTVHVGRGQAPAEFRTNKLTLDDAALHAPQLTQLLAQEVTRRGGQLLPSPIPPAPKKVVVDIGPAVITPPEPSASGLPAIGWALLGLTALSVGVGAYLLLRNKDSGKAADDAEEAPKKRIAKQSHSGFKALPPLPSDDGSASTKPKKKRARKKIAAAVSAEA